MKMSIIAAAFIMCLTIVGYSLPCGAVYLSVPNDLQMSFSESANILEGEICLSDIASVRTNDEMFMRAIDEVTLGTAPGIGHEKSLSDKYIELRLRQRKIDPTVLPVKIPDEVLITAKAMTISGSELVNQGMMFLKDKWGDLPEGMSADPVGDVVLPVGAVSYECGLSGGSLESAAASVDVKILVDKHPEVTVPLRFYSVANGAGKNLLANAPFQDTRQLVQSTNKQENAPLIYRGDLVTAVARTGATKVTVQAEAREDGYLGQYIEVRNIDTGARLQGLVTSAGVVEVNTGG